ncbi:MAG: T9SS type A sorting domain-containing protein, partial [Muribaculaceae bacterium]|nr:T9SS type A sorting domain-containing protein [Muribaculaceae bacterium]
NIYDLVTSMGSQADLGNTEAHYKEHVTNIKQSREYAAALGLKAFGSNFYSIQYLCSPYKAHGDYLAQNCFQTKALVPVVDWKKAKSYNAVTGLVYTDGKLSWNPVTDGMSTIRYSVYAIPTTVSQKAAMNSDGDGFDAKYLQGVSYLPTFSISSNLQSGYWYAVCVYDGYGNEHAAATTDFDYNGPEPGADGEIYDKNGTVSVECVWFKTVNNGGITFNENGGLNRAFCAVGDYVYISGRESNSSTAAAYLRKINGATGAVVGDIKLGAEASVGLYPCNDVIKDQSGNVCITNLTLDAKTTPLKVHKVNLSNGALTEVASLTVTSTIPNVEKARIDHAALWGDVAKGDFTVYAAISSSASVVRWNFEAGTLVSEQVCTVAQFYPSTVTNFGTAPRVVPVSSTAFYIDGGNTAWSRYLFSNGRMSDSFTENEAIAPTTYFGNGGTFFSLNNNYYITYNSADYEGSYKFNIASSTSKNMGFDTMKLMWTLPKSGMGTVNSGTAQASADYVQVSDDTVRVYYYVPGVGVCAYEIVDSAVSGIDDTVAADVKIVAAGNTIKVSEVAQSINVYNMMGMQVAYAANVQEVDVNVPSGIYIVVVTIDGVAYKQKIVLK